MSDSDGEEPKAGQKKDMFYKIKALKRRTMHAVAVTTKKAEVTKDPEFDDLYERFEEVLWNFSCPLIPRSGLCCLPLPHVRTPVSCAT
jgi:hypothetical protein